MSDKHFHFDKGTHDFWMTDPKIMGTEVMRFISKHNFN